MVSNEKYRYTFLPLWPSFKVLWLTSRNQYTPSLTHIVISLLTWKDQRPWSFHVNKRWMTGQKDLNIQCGHCHLHPLFFPHQGPMQRWILRGHSHCIALYREKIAAAQGALTPHKGTKSFGLEQCLDLLFNDCCWWLGHISGNTGSGSNFLVYYS